MGYKETNNLENHAMQNVRLLHNIFSANSLFK
jgi:hypothetical protein